MKWTREAVGNAAGGVVGIALSLVFWLVAGNFGAALVLGCIGSAYIGMALRAARRAAVKEREDADAKALPGELAR